MLPEQQPLPIPPGIGSEVHTDPSPRMLCLPQDGESSCVLPVSFPGKSGVRQETFRPSSSVLSSQVFSPSSPHPVPRRLPQFPFFPTVSFLRSGTKLIFRRRPRQKEAGLSQSHDDLSNTTATPSVRKKAGSFSRRLIKRFSFKSKPKANGNPNPQL